MPGSGGLSGGVLTITGSGRIASRDSNCHFAWRRLTVGGEGSVSQVTARLNRFDEVTNGLIAGLMISNSLDPAAPFMFGGLGCGVNGPADVATDG